MTTTQHSSTEGAGTVTPAAGEGKATEGKTGKPAGARAAELAGKKQRKAASAFRTISEVADELDVQQHVLRFWETKFSQVKPLKRGGGRRYYRPEDVALLKKIHNLLYTEGYTIKGVQKLLKGQGRQQAAAGAEAPKAAANQAGSPKDQLASATKPAVVPAAAVPPAAAKAGLSDKQRSILKAMLGDLKELRDTLTSEGPAKG
jgi:DNA-binding transcriptional MerR regulator